MPAAHALYVHRELPVPSLRQAPRVLGSLLKSFSRVGQGELPNCSNLFTEFLLTKAA